MPRRRPLALACLALAFGAGLRGLGGDEASARATLRARGSVLEDPAPPRTAPEPPPDPDVLELIRRGGRLPEGFAPHGSPPAEPLPVLSVLGARVRLELREGVAEALLEEVPEGSRAQKLGLQKGDALLEVEGKPVDPAGLLALETPLAGVNRPGEGQRALHVRRTHGGIERIVVATWARTESPR